MRLANNEEPADVKQLVDDSAADMDAVRSVLERTRQQDEADITRNGYDKSTRIVASKKTLSAKTTINP
jgi:hypothetical protein